MEYRPTASWYDRHLRESDPVDWIVAEVWGSVVGYGHALWDWAEMDGTHVYLHLGWVAPEWRGQGVGTVLLSRLEARCRERAVADGTLARAEFGANASETENDARKLLEANRYTPAYTMLDMAFAVEQQVPAVPIPAGYAVRPVEPEHYRAIWQCIGDAYYEPGQTGRFDQAVTSDDYRRYFCSPSADPSLWFVAWQDSRIAGQVLCRIEQGCAEIFEVSVAHAHRRRGLASALIARAVRALQQRGVPAIVLHTREENPTHAWKLYEQMGFRIVKRFPRWRKRIV
jgi:ribosomal protein S18 acetylase RimI-like enzyme